MLTTNKTSQGNFDVLWNGQPTGWIIVNGSLGVSGRDTRNMYGIAKGDLIKWVGPLASCKKLLTLKLSAQSK